MPGTNKTNGSCLNKNNIMLDPDRELNLRQFINDITKKAIFRSSHRSLHEIPSLLAEAPFPLYSLS